jgi:peptidoglycan LD-endopeptidase CwlK
MSSRLLADLEPVTRDMAVTFLEDCRELGIDILVTCTYRSPQEQDALYAQGRTDHGGIVTNAKGGQSPHNFGMALDVVPIVNGKPDWNTASAEWEALASMDELQGLGALPKAELEDIRVCKKLKRTGAGMVRKCSASSAGSSPPSLGPGSSPRTS